MLCINSIWNRLSVGYNCLFLYCCWYFMENISHKELIVNVKALGLVIQCLCFLG